MNPDPDGPRLSPTLVIIVLIKIALLLVAKHLWFSQPIAHHMNVEPQRLDQQFLSTAPTPISAPSGEHHARPL